MIELVEIATTRLIQRRVSIWVAYLSYIYIISYFFIKIKKDFLFGVGAAYTPGAPTSGRPNTIQFWVRLTANPEQCVITPKVRRAHHAPLFKR